mmetsp:Transcript_14542/g.20401  ORF Transcript_14542/g.20401 Transcript_14542/m.20401 type:complete len:118 (+) Transcript_14542:2-355(+)
MLGAEGAALDAAIEFDVPDEVVVRRICGRLQHVPSGRVYHVDFSPPKVAGIDDVTGEPLTQRKDDNEATVRKRLESFHKYTKPVLGYYKGRNILHRLNANQHPTKVWEDLQGILRDV